MPTTLPVAVGVRVPCPHAPAYLPVPPVITSRTLVFFASVRPRVVMVPCVRLKSTSHMRTPAPMLEMSWQLAATVPCTSPETTWLATRNWSPTDGPGAPRSPGVSESILLVKSRWGSLWADAVVMPTVVATTAVIATMPTDAATRLLVMGFPLGCVLVDFFGGASTTVAVGGCPPLRCKPHTCGRNTRRVIVGREVERAAIEVVIADAAAGQPGVLGLVGDAGVGKTALLDGVRATGGAARFVGLVGRPSDSWAGYGGAASLLRQLSTHLDALPTAQRDAVVSCLAPAQGVSIDPLLLGSGLLGLLGEA